jgi:hypothetical protein
VKRRDLVEAAREAGLPSGTASDALEPRFSTANAAKFLGCTVRHVEHLIEAGVLDAWDIRLPGAKRARWSVPVASVRVLLAEIHRCARSVRVISQAPTVHGSGRDGT